MKIVLVGAKGVGKTTMGRDLAKKTHIPFFDVDGLLHATMQFPSSESYSEARYREKKRLEYSIISQILTQQNRFILSTGAGFMNGYYDDEEVIQRVKSFTKIICLREEEDTQRSSQANVDIIVKDKSPDEVLAEISKYIGFE